MKKGKRVLSRELVLWLALGLTVIGTVWPEYLGDQGNPFLEKFVSEHLLALLGVILAITLASAGNLHLALNRLQEHSGKQFRGTRAAVRKSAYTLIVLFAAALALVIVKPLLAHWQWTTTLFNVLAILIVAVNISVLVDLTRAVFKIPAMPQDT